MKRFVACISLTAAFWLCVGCNNSGYPYKAQKPPASAYYRPTLAPPPTAEAENKKVEILSEPAGARIEVNDDYVGNAPITVEIPQSAGYFKTTTTIRALPTEAGDYTQQKMFFAPLLNDGVKIPSRILFDMHLVPATPSIDVNVNPRTN
jgi:hypothetical protein